MSKGRVSSIKKRTSKAGKDFWVVQVEDEGGNVSGDMLCFDAKIEAVPAGQYFDYTTRQDGDTTFLNFPKAEGQKQSAFSPGRGRQDDPDSRLFSAHTMVLSYAKDLVVNSMPPDITLGDALQHVSEAYAYLHSLLFRDDHIMAIMKRGDK